MESPRNSYVTGINNEEQLTFLKIRRRYDGLFSTGGYVPKFTPKGKTWTGIGPLRNHINLINDPHTYNNCEIVEFQVITKEISSKPAIEEIIESQERTRKKQEKREIRAAQEKCEEDLRKLRELQNKYGSSGLSI